MLLLRLLPRFFLLILLINIGDGTVAMERLIQIMNNSFHSVEIYWVSPVTGTKILQSTPNLRHGKSLTLNSHVGHIFEVREIPDKKTGACKGESDVCRVDHFTVNDNVNQSSKSYLYSCYSLECV